MTNSVLDPWEVSEADFPATGSTAEKLAFILNYAVMAPSGHNTQPWQFRLTDDCIELYADRTAALPVIDPEDRELTMSCGAALFNLRVALRYFGYKCDVLTFPKPSDPDLLAEARLGPSREPSAEDKMLFAAIPKRRTNRNKFEEREVPEILLSELQVAAAQEGAWLHVIQRDDVRTAVADLIAEGDRQQWQDESFRRELASWTHSSRQMRRDGIPGYAKGVSETAAYAGPFAGEILASLGAEVIHVESVSATGRHLGVLKCRPKLTQNVEGLLEQPDKVAFDNPAALCDFTQIIAFGPGQRHALHLVVDRA